MPFFARILALAGAVLFIAGTAEAESLTLTLGEIHREPTVGTVANVVVADPTVADVTVIDQHSVVILGKGFGTTGILVTDHAGRVLIDDRIVVAAPSDESRVTLYRGIIGSDYACMPRCRALEAPGGSGGVASAATASAAGGGASGPPSLYAPPSQNLTASTVSPPVTVTTSHP